MVFSGCYVRLYQLTDHDHLLQTANLPNPETTGDLSCPLLIPLTIAYVVPAHTQASTPVTHPDTRGTRPLYLETFGVILSPAVPGFGAGCWAGGRCFVAVSLSNS